MAYIHCKYYPAEDNFKLHTHMGTFDLGSSGLSSGRSLEEYKDFLRAIYDQKPYSMPARKGAFNLNCNGLSVTITAGNQMFDVDSSVMIEPLLQLIKQQ